MSKKTTNTKATAAKVIETTAKNVLPLKPAAPAPATPPAPLPKPVYKPAIEARAMTETEAARAKRYEKSMLMSVLSWMLSHKRPHDSASERNALGYILRNLPDKCKWTFDGVGNLHVDARERFSNEGELVHSRTLFTAHVDTVHHQEGFNKIRMTESVWYAQGSQLGADDGAGVAMLMHMLHHGIAAYYLFTVGEECGGVGAKEVGENAKLLAKFDRAIAFDRRGTTSVISHQGWGRCASDAFCEALSGALCDQGLLYMPDDTGVYTDTAEFVDGIAECTNISVGYEREHSSEEALDIPHFQHLADAVLQIQWDALPVVRTPGDNDYPAYGSDSNKPWYMQGVTTKQKDGSALLWDDLAEELVDALGEFKNGSSRSLRVTLAAEQSCLFPKWDRADILDYVDKRLEELSDDLVDACTDALGAGAAGYDVLVDLWDAIGGHDIPLTPPTKGSKR